MNADVLRAELTYDFDRAVALLKAMAQAGMLIGLSEYHPVTDAMSRLAAALESDFSDRDLLRETLVFSWNVLHEYEWEIFEYHNRNNAEWLHALACARRPGTLPAQPDGFDDQRQRCPQRR